MDQIDRLKSRAHKLFRVFLAGFAIWVAVNVLGDLLHWRNVWFLAVWLAEAVVFLAFVTTAAQLGFARMRAATKFPVPSNLND